MISASGFAFRPGEDGILDAVYTELRAIKQSGEWLRIAKPFGFGPDNLPGPNLETDTLCG